MQPLDPQFRRMLLAQSPTHLVPWYGLRKKLPKRSGSASASAAFTSRRSSNDDYEYFQPQLTPKLLDEYEELVGRSLVLRRALLDEFKQAGQKGLPPNTYKKIKMELIEVNNQLQGIVSSYMPFFHNVHNVWLAHRRALVLGSANRSFKKFWQRTPAKPGGLSTFAVCVAAFSVIAVSCLPFMPLKEQPGWPGLSDQEVDLMQEWESGAGAGDDRYLTHLVTTKPELTRELGTKLIQQGDQALAQGDTVVAALRFARAASLGAYLKQVEGDGRLSVVADRSLQRIAPEALAVK